MGGRDSKRGKEEWVKVEEMIVIGLSRVVMMGERKEQPKVVKD